VGDWVAKLEYRALPSTVVESVKDRLIDTLGVALAGRLSDAGIATRRAALKWGGADAAVLGEELRLSAPSAALINGTYAHSLDYDDTHLPSLIHPSAPLIPAVLAVAEPYRVSGSQVIVALAAGYEVFCCLAMAQYDSVARNSVFFEKGLHLTGILGTIASAVACAKAMDGDAAMITNALSVACSMGGGILEGNRAGGSIKKVHAGWAAHGGVSAAEFAANGLTGPATSLEGGFGFFRAYCGERWSDQPITELGRIWRTPEICYKAYPCNVFTHALVDAALRFRAQGVDATQVIAIRIGLAGPSWRAVGDPIDEKRRPRTPYHAKFSAPYVFAASLLGGGGLGIAETDFGLAQLRSQNLIRLMAITDVVADEECDRIFPEQFPARVILSMKGGATLEEWVPASLGGPDRRLNRSQILTKLKANVGEASASIIEACLSLETSPSAESLLRAVTARTAA
jgi:2-methylcitrate dehydratase PrpD